MPLACNGPFSITKFDLYLNESQSFPKMYLDCFKDQDNAPSNVVVKGMFNVLSILLQQIAFSFFNNLLLSIAT